MCAVFERYEKYHVVKKEPREYYYMKRLSYNTKQMIRGNKHTAVRKKWGKAY